MSPWCDDLSTASLQEVLESQVENRAWSKELRRKTSELVNSRLAKDISQADYQANRKLADADATECQRRANMLNEHVVRHTSGSLLRRS